MSLNHWMRCLSSHKTSFSSLLRNKCLNQGLRRHTTSSSDNLLRHPKTKRVVSLLQEFELNDNQIKRIVDTIGKYIVEEKDLSEEAMRETIECWHSLLRQPALRANQLDKYSPEDIDFDMSVDFNHVVSRIEPKLLLMNANAIEYRIQCLQ